MEMMFEVDDERYEILRKRAENKGFQSTEEYCKTILEIVSDELETESEMGEGVENRLEDLGYLS